MAAEVLASTVGYNDPGEAAPLRDRAAWAMRIIRDLRRARAEECGAYDAEIARLQARRDALWAAYEAKEAQPAGVLGLYLSEIEAATGKHHADLPCGRVSSRRVPAGPRVADSAAAMAWAREHATDLVRTEVREVLDARGLLAHVRGTGEVVDGVEWSQEHVNVTITPSEEESV